MDDETALRALLGTIGRVLRDQGVDPSSVTDEDKLLIATGYVEAWGVREKMEITTLPEDQIRARLFDSAP